MIGQCFQQNFHRNYRVLSKVIGTSKNFLANFQCKPCEKGWRSRWTKLLLRFVDNLIIAWKLVELTYHGGIYHRIVSILIVLIQFNESLSSRKNKQQKLREIKCKWVFFEHFLPITDDFQVLWPFFSVGISYVI